MLVFIFLWQCEDCGQSFFNREIMHKHQIRHKNSKRLTCPMDGCESNYLWYYGLKRHFRKQHPNDLKNAPTERQFYDQLALVNS